MRKLKQVPSAIVIALLAGLLVIAVVSTITLAAFNFARNATTTLRFADNVTLDVAGVNNAHVWLASSDNNATFIINDATLTAPAFKSIDVKVTSGPSTNVDVYVRVFAICYTTYSSIQNITAGSGSTTTTSYTAQEQALINAVPKNGTNPYPYSVQCVVKQYSAVSTNYETMINQFYPLTQTLNSTHLGAEMHGIVVITAKNRGATDPAITTDAWNTVLPDAQYPTWG